MNKKEYVQSKVYELTEPGVFEKQIKEIEVKEDHVVVTPTLASICHADLRYFNGQRRQDALKEKLPMALFHEGIGLVSQSKHPQFQKGDRVVIVPNIPGYILNGSKKDECCYVCRNEENDNYCTAGVFLGSGYDGISQSKLVIHGNNLVKIPSEVSDEIALLAELCSVSLFAINRVSHLRNHGEKVAVFGDGPVGYLTAASLRYVYNLKKEDIIIFGADEEKIKHFEKFGKTALVFDYNFNDFANVRTVFECTGGRFSSSAINQAIDLINREGTIVLMGVSEELVPINTRDILEKGLSIVGSSRSTRTEFEQLMEAFKNEQFVKVLEQLVPDVAENIYNIKDLKAAMIQATKNRGWQKTYLSFHWSE